MDRSAPIRLAAFDVDGTLLRGRTVCECIAAGIGREAEMAAFEQLTSQEDIAAARETMASWYGAHPQEDLIACLDKAQVADGIEAGFDRLRRAGVKIALVSITWRPAVEALAGRWGADYAIGTGFTPAGEVEHFWPRDKATWLIELMRQLEFPIQSLAAVGDSSGDLEMLSLARLAYFVGERPVDLPAHVMRRPGANIADLAQDMLRERP